MTARNSGSSMAPAPTARPSRKRFGISGASCLPVQSLARPDLRANAPRRTMCASGRNLILTEMGRGRRWYGCGSPQIVDAARLADGGRALVGADGRHLEFSLTKKIDSNRSYFDDSSRRHFAGRRLKMRGRVEGDRFVARTI
jgi:hypothetical protein